MRIFSILNKYNFIVGLRALSMVLPSILIYILLQRNNIDVANIVADMNVLTAFCVAFFLAGQHTKSIYHVNPSTLFMIITIQGIVFCINSYFFDISNSILLTALIGSQIVYLDGYLRLKQRYITSALIISKPSLILVSCAYLFNILNNEALVYYMLFGNIIILLLLYSYYSKEAFQKRFDGLSPKYLYVSSTSIVNYILQNVDVLIISFVIDTNTSAAYFLLTRIIKLLDPIIHSNVAYQTTQLKEIPQAKQKNFMMILFRKNILLASIGVLLIPITMIILGSEFSLTLTTLIFINSWMNQISAGQGYLYVLNNHDEINLIVIATSALAFMTTCYLSFVLWELPLSEVFIISCMALASTWRTMCYVVLLKYVHLK